MIDTDPLRAERNRNSFIAIAAFSVLTAVGVPIAIGAEPPGTAKGGVEVKDSAAGEWVSQLKQLLFSEPEAKGFEAAYRLQEVAGKDFGKIFEEFIGKLKSPDATERRRAAVALGRLCCAVNRCVWETGIYDRSLTALGTALEDADVQVREAAADGLAIAFDREGADATPVAGALRKALGDSHRPVRVAAVKAIGSGGLSKFLPEVIALFHDPNPDIRREAAVSAGKLSPHLGLQDIVRPDESEERTGSEGVDQPRTQKQPIDALPAEAVAGLMELANDTDAQVRAAAVEALGGKWGEAIPPAATTLDAAVRDKSEEVRVAAAKSLPVLGKQATPSLLVALKDEERPIAVEAANSLGRIHHYRGLRNRGPRPGAEDGPESQESAGSDGEPKPEKIDASTREAAAALATILADPRADDDLREAAAEALDKIGPGAADAAEIISRALSDEDKDIRTTAMHVLQSIGAAAEGQIPAIAAVIRSRPKTPPKTCGSFRRVDPFGWGPKFPEDASGDDRPGGPFSDTDYDQTRYDAVRVLDIIARDAGNTQTAIPPLIDALGDWNVETAQLAAEALARRGDAALPALMEALNGDDVLRRRSAAYAIARFEKGPPAAVPRLTALLKDEDADVAWSAAQALENIAPSNEKTVSALIVALDHRDGYVRIQSADALGAIGPDAARPAVPKLLKMFLESPNRWVRSAAMGALVKIGVDREIAVRLSRVELAETAYPWQRADVLAALLDYPDLALAHLRDHPSVLAIARPELIVRIVERNDPESQPLRQAVLESDRLPREVMAWVGDPRFIPILKKRMKDADPYLEGCARACGAEPGQIMTISKGQRADRDFWRSRHPGEPQRVPLRLVDYQLGGPESICVTGRIAGKDGGAVPEPRFLYFDGRRPLGTRIEDFPRVKYNPQTGRFALFYMVSTIMAWDQGGDAHQWACPVHLLIEAKGYEPLEVILHGEMPDVLITLEPEE